ncbi:interleukin-22 receptor subunit alpha-2 [Gasterosteus aculeatus]
MTDLLLRVVLLGNLGATGPAPLMLAAPTGVRFDSVDYRNVVHWTPASNSCSLQYHVQWKIYGEPQWLDAPGCQWIHKTRCDLSAVTSDPREWYYARVHASCRPSGKTAWALSPRFSPRWDTEISPPVLRLEVTKRGIVVRVKPPRLTVRKKHGDLLHEIYLIHPGGREEVFEMICCSNKLPLKRLKHNATFCLQGQTVIPLQAKSSGRSAVKCVTTL